MLNDKKVKHFFYEYFFNLAISNGTIVKYVYGNGLISSYETTSTPTVNSIIAARSGQYTYEITTEYQSYSYDLRGSVTSVSNENGTVTAEYSYSTYGERTVIEGKDEDTSSSLRDKLLKDNQRTETTASKVAGLNAGTQGKITIGGSGFGTGTDLGLGDNAKLNTRFNKEIEITTSYCYDRENKNLLVTTDSDGIIVKYVYGNGLISSYETKANTTEYQSYSYDLRGSG